MRYQLPTDKDLTENGMLDRFDLVFKTPLKWVYVFFIIFVMFLFWLIPYLDDTKVQRINETHKYRQLG